jgi:hypothetical protein
MVLSIVAIVILTSVVVYSADAAGIPKKAISTVSRFIETDLPTTTLFTDVQNTITSIQQFTTMSAVFENPAKTFGTTLSGGAVTANRTLNLPVITGTDTLGALGMTQSWTGNNDFGISGATDKFDGLGIIIRNPAHTFATTLSNPAITANRTLNLPLITGTDTLDALNTAGTYTANHQFTTTSGLYENTAKTFSTTLAGGAVTANQTLNLPLITGTDTLGALNVAQKWTANQTLQNPQINGFDVNYTSYTSNKTPQYTEDVIKMDTSSATLVLTLPTAVGHTGKIFTILNTGLSASNILQIETTSSQTIDGYFSSTGSMNLTKSSQVLSVQSDGANWNIIKNLDTSFNEFFIKGSTAQWYGSAMSALAPGTQISVVTTLRASPWIVSHTITIDKIQAEISTAANPTSTTCRIGIYRDNGNAYPQALVSGSDVGTFTTTAGVKTNTFASPITLNEGLYWLAYSCGSAATTQPTWRALAAGAVPPVLGAVSTMGVNGPGTAYTVAFTFAALPAQYPAGATILTDQNLPAQILVEIQKG